MQIKNVVQSLSLSLRFLLPLAERVPLLILRRASLAQDDLRDPSTSLRMPANSRALSKALRLLEKKIAGYLPAFSHYNFFEVLFFMASAPAEILAIAGSRFAKLTSRRILAQGLWGNQARLEVTICDLKTGRNLRAASSLPQDEGLSQRKH